MTTARKITNAWVHRTLPDIFYEEPEAIEDGMQQELPIEHIKGPLREYFEGRDDVFVSNAVFLSYDSTNGNARVQPDLFIAFGVDEPAIRQNLPNFWVWETGKAPDFVMEVASPSTASNDLGSKRDLYERLGVTEYWRFDPTGGDLYGQRMAGERLVDGRFLPYEIDRRADGSELGHSELLNLDFYWDGTRFNVLDPATGKPIDRLSLEREARQIAEAELRTTEAERQIAEDRAQRAELEVARLRQQLSRQEGQ